MKDGSKLVKTERSKTKHLYLFQWKAIMSSSSHVRQQGNSHYKNASSENLAPILRRQRLEKSLEFYQRAKELATNPDDMASALKNIGNANWRIAQILTSNPSEKRVTVTYYFQESVKSFDLALCKGSSCKPEEWKDGILLSLSSCLEEAIAFFENFSSTDDRLRLLETLSHHLNIKQLTLDVQLKIGKLVFYDGASKLQNFDYKGALSRMRDCYYHIEEAKKLANIQHDAERIEEVKVLEQDVFYHSSAAESIQAREHGRQILDTATQQEEELNLELIWDVIDWYKQATILARELDIEQEAIALSYLGYVYDKVLKIQSKAKEYFMRSLQLAESLKPRTFSTHAWYQDCVSAIQRYQEEKRLKEEQAKERENAKVLEELKEELIDLKLHNTGKVELLKHVYTKYPPTLKNWKKPSETEMAKWAKLEHRKLKSLLQKAVIAYHPDKVDEEKHGKKWKVLSEEITKLITQHYETMK